MAFDGPEPLRLRARLVWRERVGRELRAGLAFEGTDAAARRALVRIAFTRDGVHEGPMRAARPRSSGWRCGSCSGSSARSCLSGRDGAGPPRHLALGAPLGRRPGAVRSRAAPGRVRRGDGAPRAREASTRRERAPARAARRRGVGAGRRTRAGSCRGCGGSGSSTSRRRSPSQNPVSTLRRRTSARPPPTSS